MGQTSALFAGYLYKGKREFLNAYVYQAPNTQGAAAIFNESGRFTNAGPTIDTTVAQTMLDDMERVLGQQVENFFMIESPVDGGQTLPNWDAYQSMNP